MEIRQHITKYRKACGLTQDALGERLHVTRQTVSSWENGRTLPDIQMLTHIAETLGVSIEQLIYGRDTAAEPRDITQYKRAALVSALITALSICTALLIRPQLGYTVEAYRILPELLYYSILHPVSFLAGAVCFLSLLSLAGDISIRNYRLRRLFLFVGAGLILAFLCLVLLVYSAAPGRIWAHRIWFWTVFHPYIFVIPAVCLFFGANRPS